MDIKLKPAPILKMLGVTTIVAVLIVLIIAGFRLLPNYDSLANSGWILADLVHIPQFLIPFLLIWFMSKGKLEEYGFNLRGTPDFTHKRMLTVGGLFGLAMSLRYIPQIIGDLPVDIPQPVTPVNIIGYMTFQWIIVGVSEETMFRGLIQTYLMKNLDGDVEIAGRGFHVGTVIGAIFWGGFHFINILVGMPINAVLLTVLLTTAAGLLMGYVYQETRSLLTTIIVHNTLFGVPLSIGYLLYWLT